MTKEEKWCRRLERVIKDMPETLEVSVCRGSIDIYTNGSVAKSFEQDGDADNIYKFSDFHYSIYGTGFYGNEESI